MNNYTCKAHLRPHPTQNQFNPPFIYQKPDWKSGQLLRHTKKTGESQQQKHWDFHSHNRRTHRHSNAGGFFSPVDYARRGIMSGLRGLQDGVNRNKRVAYLLGNGRTRIFCQLPKNLTGLIPMTALNTQGESRPLFPHGFPPCIPDHLQYPLPTVPVIPEPKFQFSKLSVHCSDKTHLFTLSGRPVAWVLVGHHKGQQNNQTKHVRFVDLVYLRQTQRGANLETKDFEQLSDALSFVYTLFEQGGAS